MTTQDTVDTKPFCGACGWDYVRSANRDSDGFCDACGADLSAYDPTLNPVSVTATAGSLSVSFAWTANVTADTTDFRSRIDGGVYTILTNQTTPNVVAALEGQTVEGSVRSVSSGVVGPWGKVDSAVALA